MRNEQSGRFGVVVIILALFIFTGAGIYRQRNIYSPDHYFVRVNTGIGCFILRTSYLDSFGLAPLLIDKDCSIDISRLQKGELPHLE